MFDAAATQPSSSVNRVCAALAAATLVAGLGVVPPLASPHSAPERAAVALTATGSLADSGIALIMGPSMIPTPTQHYAETVDQLFLAPHGFDGELEVLTTPQEAYLLDESMAKGAQDLVDRIMELIENGEAGADHPVTVFGYSQSAALTTLAMQQLAENEVPSSAVHFVLIGDSANPNGGLLVGFADMEDFAESMHDGGVTLGNPTPNDLYPTDIYTLEYDGYADFPQYWLNPLATINAIMGMAIQHIGYLGLDPEQVADATLLESSPDSLINSYVIESEYLPILWPLLFTPIFGKPLYDLLEPTVRMLVNLGYGDYHTGWNDGPADVPTMFSLDSQDVDWSEFNAGLVNAAQEGWDAFVAGLLDPDTYRLVNTEDNPAVAGLIAAGYGMGLGAGDDPSVQDMLRDLTDLMWNSLVGQYFDPAYWADAS